MVLIVGGCSRSAGEIQYDENVVDEENVSVSNPASVNCIEKGGDSVIKDNEDGQYGVCVFDDKSECEEWAFFKEECKKGDSPRVEVELNDELTQVEEETEDIEKEVIEIDLSDDLTLYEKESHNLSIGYYKNWYFNRDSREKDLEYDLYVGFGETIDILEETVPYSVVFVVLSDDVEFSGDFESVKVIKEEDGKKYILATDDMDTYGEVMTKMSESLILNK